MCLRKFFKKNLIKQVMNSIRKGYKIKIQNKIFFIKIKSNCLD